ncbi:MAG TPA: hypothetical protein VGR91_07595 [Stellaceae bacterium]|nr:hypothetical protein [Stellaceae bacterium]
MLRQRWAIGETVAALSLAVLMLTPFGRAAQLAIKITGPEQAVFSHSRDACRPDDTPDAPARAFRDAEGRVHLFASTFVNYASIGRSLDSVKRDCHVVFEGTGNDDPAQFNDRQWLSSFWTDDGRTVYALAHDEFQANRRPSLCPSRAYFRCWYNAATAEISTDGGFHFTTEGLVAAPIRRFDPAVGHPVGYFNPSNIVKLGAYYYAVVFAGPSGPQRRGVCLLRTRSLTRPRSWRAWGGFHFDIRLGNPYRGRASERGCEVLAPAALKSHVWSLFLNPPTNRFIALTEQDGPNPAIMFSDSTDLLSWSDPRMLVREPVATSGTCTGRALIAYPSVLDPRSTSSNFEVVGKTAYLYFTRFRFSHGDCGGTLDRDLVRVPIAIVGAP